MMGSNLDLTEWSRRARIVAPNNFRREIVCFFKGATRFFDKIILVVIVLPSSYTVLK